MNPYLSIPPKTPGRFRVGDTVRVPHAWGGALGVVIEDCGFIGRGGRRMYTLKMHVLDEPELPFAEEEIEPVTK